MVKDIKAAEELEGRIGQKVYDKIMSEQGKFSYFTEARFLNIGDANRFYTANKKSFSIELQEVRLEIGEILNRGFELEEKVEQISSKIINTIDEQIDAKISRLALKGKVTDFRHVVKLVMENEYLIDIKNGETIVYRVGVEIFP